MVELQNEYIEINNNSCIYFKMAAKMEAENLNLMYFGSAKTNKVPIHMK